VLRSSQTRVPLDPQGVAAQDDEIFRLTTREGLLPWKRGASSASEVPALQSEFLSSRAPDQLSNALSAPLFDRTTAAFVQEAAAHELPAEIGP